MVATDLAAQAELLERIAGMLRCLGHPVRLQILDLLSRNEELTVTEVYEALELEQAVASQHLSTMRDRGILEKRKDGIHVYYRIGNDRALTVLGCLQKSTA
jgi:DNA-binding transcriptional ArsR family regulator